MPLHPIESGVHHVTLTPPFPFATITQPERFFSKILPPNESGCELWAGMTDGNAGILTLGHKTKRAHRVAFEFHHGPIPAGHQVLQTCKNPTCCAKDHLWTSPNPTKKEKPPAKPRGKPAKFSDETIRKMRRLRHDGATYNLIAQVFETSAPMAYLICKFKAYAHVPAEAGLEPKTLH